MKLEEVIDEIKVELTGYILDMEITDETLVQVVNKALRELTRYWDETCLISCPFASCINLDGEFFKEKVSSIIKVYRTEGSCLGLKTHIAILSDGTVIPCCLDSGGVINLGNIFKEDLDVILNKDKTKNIINGFNNNKLCEELCQKCGFKR